MLAPVAGGGSRKGVSVKARGRGGPDRATGGHRGPQGATGGGGSVGDPQGPDGGVHVRSAARCHGVKLITLCGVTIKVISTRISTLP
jgi:hypothetical protein